MASREYEAIRKRQAEDQMATTVQSMSRKVDMIFEHLGLEVPQDEPAQAPDEGEDPMVVEGSEPAETDPAYEKSDLPGGHLPRPEEPGPEEADDPGAGLDEDMDVADLDLAEGIHSLLDEAEIETVGQLRDRLADTDNPIPGIGEKRRETILQVLREAEQSSE